MSTGAIDLADLHARARRLLEDVGPRWRDFTAYPEYFELRTVEFLLLISRLRRLEDFRPRRVLEVGCGGGYSLRLWAEIADEVTGIDLPAEVATARRLLAALPAANVKVVEGAGEDLSRVEGTYDVIITQYVLEHVRDIRKTLAEIGTHLSPGGFAIHVVPDLVDRHEWYLRYRWETSLPRRLLASIRHRGPLRTLLDPRLAFTPPHSPEFGDFAHEHQQYRLERWALHVVRAGFVVIDHFQTRDVNWVLVTRRDDAAR